MSNIIGTSGNDTLTGTAGIDYLDGGAGDDSMSGLQGDDVYLVDSPSDVVHENPNEGDDRVNATVSYSLAPNIENLWLVGSMPTSGSGNELANVLWGNGADNSISGQAGDDTIDGGGGADTMTGGTGDDTYWVDNVGDAVIENAGEGVDTVKSTLASYTLAVNAENLVLIAGAGNIDGTGNAQDNELSGNEGNNLLVGGAGNDTLNGGAGGDTLIGGLGDDTYRVDNAGDVVSEAPNEGTDGVVSTMASYTLLANVENLSLGSNYFTVENLDGTGNTLANTLLGNSGNNVLDGNAGNDTLIGGNGNDTLTGGAGNDLFYFSTDDSGTDLITDLSSGDVIEVCGAIFLTGSVTQGSGAQVGSGEVQLTTSAGQTFLLIGTDATPGADLTITLDGTYDPGNFQLSGFDIRYDTNHAPVLNTPLADQTATESQPYSFHVPANSFSDPENDPIAYSAMLFDLDEGFLALPSWLDFDTAAATFSGTPGHTDIGNFTVIVTASDPNGANNADTFTLTVGATPVGTPQVVATPPTGSISIIGSPVQGETLTVANTLADVNGMGTISYQWKAAGVDIAGADAASYTLSQGEVGDTISVSARYIDGLGTAEAVSSSPTLAVANINDQPTGSVKIDGNAIDGQTLTATNTLVDMDGLGSITYLWQASTASTWTNLGTGDSLALAEADIGKAIRVVASYTDALGSAETVSSSLTATVTWPQEGSTSDDILQGTAGNDQLNGGSGLDTGVCPGAWSTYTISKSANGYILSSSTGGADTLTNIERLQFSDKKIALDLTPDGNAGQALEFIGMLAFNLVANKAIVGEIISYVDAGFDIQPLCQLAINAGLIRALAGSDSNAALAQLVFGNVVGREASAADVDFLVGYMDGRAASYSQADFLAAVAGLELNQQHIGLVGLQNTGLEYLEFTA